MQRLNEIRELLETDLTTEELDAIELEARALVEKMEKRDAIINNIAKGRAGLPITGIHEQTDEHDFMEFVCRGKKILRNATNTADMSAAIPKTIMNEIVKKAESYGNLFNGVRRLNVQGGVSFPIMTLRPSAHWASETTPSTTQAVKVNDAVLFNYHMLECRIAQTLLASIVTLDEFQRQFIPLATEALVKAIDIGIIRGTGNGQMLGVLNDSRINKPIELKTDEVTKWDVWKKKIFAKMKKSYRDGVFIMAQGTFDGYIDGMTDQVGQPIARVNYGIDGAESYRFGGRHIEIVEDDCLQAYEDAAVGDPVAVYMRLHDYAINTNMQMNVIHWTDHDTNTLKNKCTIVLDGKIIDPNGVIVIAKG